MRTILVAVAVVGSVAVARAQEFSTDGLTGHLTASVNGMRPPRHGSASRRGCAVVSPS